MASSSRTASSSRPLAGRVPLSDMPISLFVGSATSLPSPVSIPLKRPSLPSALASSSKIRRVSSAAGDETVRRRTPTQREIEVMDKDDLGLGKSPARRLFGAAPSPTLSGRGISGAVETDSPEAGPSRLYTPSSPVQSPITPILDLAALPAATVIIENGVQVSIHHPGFSIHHDTSSPRPISPLPLTPKGKGRVLDIPALALDAPLHLAPSPTSTPGSRYNENQENIPPDPNLPTPTKAASDKGTPTKAKWLEDADGLTGSGRRRVLEKSKLGTLLASHETEEDVVLGSAARAAKTRATTRVRDTPRERMKREVDRI